jgi:hypothetical protein
VAERSSASSHQKSPAAQGHFEALEKFCRGKCCTVPEMVRVVTLRLARAL